MMENSDEQFGIRPISISTTPLHQLSPERMNQQRIPQSPSFNSYLTENDHPKQHGHRDSVSSDVQSKIAFLNGLISANTSPTRKPVGLAGPVSGNAALQRAVLGYEEAQATLTSLSAELERYKQASETSKRRERMVAERIESLIEDVQTEKSKRAADKEVYVKEIKKARKDTYRAELAGLEVREELKDLKAEMKKSVAELAHEKEEKEKARQESFERAYALAGLTEETEVLKEKLRVVEQERDTAILELQNATQQAQEKVLMGDIAVQTDREIQTMTTPNGDETTGLQESPAVVSPDKSHVKSDRKQDLDATPGPTKELVVDDFDAWTPPNDVTNDTQLPANFNTWISSMNRWQRHLDGEELSAEDQILFLKDELARARRQTHEDKDMIRFLHVQCQFKACPCRVAERSGKRYIYDHEYERQQQERVVKKRKIEEENEKAAVLPPDPGHNLPEQDSTLPKVEEVAQIPLPSADFDSPDPTTNLEELTQVLVEPGPSDKPFSFSMSMSSNSAFRSSVPPSNHIPDGKVDAEQALFDLSPPRPMLPRPATSLGIFTSGSPIRLVPESPQTVHARSKPTSPYRNSFQMSSTSTKVALKDSPQRQHRRTQSRPDIRSRSRGRSPLVFSSAPEQDQESATASPTSTASFPVTPIIKHARSQHHLARRMANNSTTVTIPLRDTELEAQPDPLIPRPHSSMDSHNRPSTSSVDMLIHDPSIPGTPISREEALAQIRARRDRARSVNLQKEAVNNTTRVNGPASAKRSGESREGLNLSNGNTNTSRGRDFSQASAPGRF